jgi:hypothetical protein
LVQKNVIGKTNVGIGKKYWTAPRFGNKRDLRPIIGTKWLDRSQETLLSASSKQPTAHDGEHLAASVFKQNK